jgi:uncharacterized protein YjdB
VGSHALIASYNGSTIALPSDSNILYQNVDQSPTSTTLVSSPNPSTVGQTVTLLAEVAPATATGSVIFYAGTTPLGTGTLTSGKAAIATSKLPKGKFALSASYFGDSNYLPSVSFTVTQVVN